MNEDQENIVVEDPRTTARTEAERRQWKKLLFGLPCGLDARVVRYLARAPFKDNALQDLRKARFYLDDLIKVLEAGGKAHDVDLDARSEDP